MPGAQNVGSPNYHFITDPLKARTGVAAADVGTDPVPGTSTFLIPLHHNIHGFNNQLWILPKLAAGGTPGTSKCSISVYGRYANTTTGAVLATMPDWILLSGPTQVTDKTMVQLADLPAMQLWIKVTAVDAGTTWDIMASFSWNTVERLSDKWVALV